MDLRARRAAVAGGLVVIVLAACRRDVPTPPRPTVPPVPASEPAEPFDLVQPAVAGPPVGDVWDEDSEQRPLEVEDEIEGEGRASWDDFLGPGG